MPTYQYRCTECGHDLEAVQRFTDAALTECPNCSGSLRKIFNAVGVVFKGSGFYRTDSRAGAKDGNGTNGSEKPESSSGSDSESGQTVTSGEKTGDKSGEKGGDKPGVAAKAESGSKSAGGTKQTAAAGSSSTGSAS